MQFWTSWPNKRMFRDRRFWTPFCKLASRTPQNLPLNSRFWCRTSDLGEISLPGSVAKQDGVGLHRPSLDRQFCPIRREPEPRDSLRSEVRQLARRRVIQRLLPKIIRSFFTNKVHHRFGVRREGQW